MVDKVLLVVLALALGGGVMVETASAETTLVRTGQMWGADKSDGKVDAVLGIAGECAQTENHLTCQFVSLSLSADDKCSVIVSTWTEHLRRASRTREEVRWAGTKGPTGAAGVLQTTVLIAKSVGLIGGKDYFNDPGYGPGPVDTWSYQATQAYTNPVFGKKMPPGVAEVTGKTAQPKFCRPTEAMLMAISPAAGD